MLESPTGTGKTLCLLSSVLAWRSTWVAKAELAALGTAGYEAYRAADGVPGLVAPETSLRLDAQLNASAGTGSDTTESSLRKVPLIIYASRTHSQLAQVVRELGTTAYRPKLAVMGSREQLCVNSAVRATGSPAAQQALCQQLVQKKACEAYGKVGEALTACRSASAAGALLDIEELQRLARVHQACPFYLAREGQAEADILFMPYNYLVDRRARAGLGLDLGGAVVIFDEAHNLEGCCGEAVSGALTSEQLQGAAEETMEIARLLEKAIAPIPGVGPEECNAAQAFLRTLCAQLQSVPLELAAGDNQASGKQGSFRADFAYELVQRAGASEETVRGLLDRMVNLAKALLEQRHAAGKSKGFRCSLHSVADFLRILFRPSEEKEDAGFVRAVSGPDSKAFRVHIAETAKGQQRTLSLWCFCPGVALRDLAALGVRSILLASGTLSPLEPLALEMQLPFEHRLENGHVIDADRQLLASVLCTGPRGHPLNASYGQRDSPAYKTELGLAIASVAPHIPGGLLVFFPSYAVMDACLGHWKVTEDGNGRTLWAALARLKTPFVEPREKGELARCLSAYERAVDTAPSGPDSPSGAILFAVCRGKVSEGLDFADARGRAVIITGIPFPPAREARVLLKRDYLADLAAGGLSGDQWYSQQAARAVNQAIGRVIRHRHDYGAVLFFDERFAQPRISSQLSKWIRPHVRHAPSATRLATELGAFFRVHAAAAVGQAAAAVEAEAVRSFAEAAAGQAARMEAVSRAKAFFRPNPFHIPAGDPSEQPAGLVEPKLPSALLGLVAKRHAPSPPPPPAALADDRLCEAKDFMARVKQRLPADSCQRFTALIKSYKAHRVDCPALLDSLLRLLHAHAALDLFPALKGFLPERYAPLVQEKLAAFQAGSRAWAKENVGPEGNAEIGTKRTAVQSFFGMAAPAPKIKIELPPAVKIEPSAPVPKIKIEPVTQRLLARNNLPLPASPITNPPIMEPVAGVSDACPICRDKYEKPFRAKCGHVCCFPCWSAWLSNTLECPICRNRTRLSQLKKIY